MPTRRSPDHRRARTRRVPDPDDGLEESDDTAGTGSEDPSEPWMPSDDDDWGEQRTADTSPVVGSGVPAVVAIVPTCDPGPTFEEALGGLAAQEYANLSVLVVDSSDQQGTESGDGNGEEGLTHRVAAILPGAFVRRSAASGWAEAVNDAAGSVEGATFLLVCHDDTELAPGAVSALVAEAFSSNAGVVGAKLVDWDAPDRIRSLGFSVDKFGEPSAVAEEGELDQAQHDAVRETFWVSSAAMLVRTDLFADLGGFSTALAGGAEELDLCWRARIAGGRTVVMPAAVARHRERSPWTDPDPGERGRNLALRHQARTVLACYSPFHLMRVLPQAAVASFVELIASLLTGRFRRAGAVVSAWGWNVAHLPSTISLRGRVARSRRVPDSQVRAVQVRGSARLSAALRRLRGATPGAVNRARGLTVSESDRILPGLVLVLSLVLVGLIGSRGLIGDGVPVVGDLVPIDHVGALVRGWWAGWQTAGVGHRGASSSLVPLVGAADLVTFGSTGFVRLSLLLLPLVLGPLGAWRMFRGLPRPWASVAAALATVLNPVPIEALSTGRVDVLAVWATLPWLFGRLARSSGVPPFDGDRAAPVPLRRHALGAGLTVAAGVLLAPVVWLASCALGVLVSIGLLASGRAEGARRSALTTVGGALVAAGLHLPLTLDLVGNPDRWTVLTGSMSPAPQPVKMWDLVRLTTGSATGGFLLLGVTAAALLPILVGRSWRLRWGAIGWLVAIASWAAAVASARLWPDTVVPTLGVFLAVAATGLSACVGLAAETAVDDVVGGAFGVRQLAAVLTGVVLVLGVVPLMVAAVDGHWDLPTTDLDRSLASLEATDGRTGRTLWLGDPEDLPSQGWRLDPGLAFTTTEGVHTNLGSNLPGAAGPGEEALASALRAAPDSGGARLGRALAPFAIRQVVVVTAPDDTSRYPSRSAEVVRVLSEQLDLKQIEVAGGIALFENEAARSIRVLLPPGSPVGDAGPSLDPLAVGEPVLPPVAPPVEFQGPLSAGTVAVALNRDSGWSLRVGDTILHDDSTSGWAQRYDSPTGAGTLAYEAPVGHRLVLVLQALLVVMVLAARRHRTGSRASPEPEPDLETGVESESEPESEPEPEPEPEPDQDTDMDPRAAAP